MRHENILLLGANGFIGKNLVDFLFDAGYVVHILDKNKFISKQNQIIKQVNISISETDKLKDYIENESIKTVIHLVSGLLPSSSSKDFHQEMVDVIIPTFHLIDILSESKVKFVYFSSGGTVYGQCDNSMLKEDQLCNPSSYYGYSKLMIEEYLRVTHRKTDLSYLVIRPSNPYGRYQNPNKKQGFIAVALDKIIKNENIEIWGDGSTIRDYIYIDDLCLAVTNLLLNNIENMSLNIGSGVGHSLLDVIDVLEHVCGREISIIFKGARVVDVRKAVLNVEKVKNLISFKPISLMDGIKSYYNFLQKGDN